MFALNPAANFLTQSLTQLPFQQKTQQNIVKTLLREFLKIVYYKEKAIYIFIGAAQNIILNIVAFNGPNNN